MKIKSKDVVVYINGEKAFDVHGNTDNIKVARKMIEEYIDENINEYDGEVKSDVMLKYASYSDYIDKKPRRTKFPRSGGNDE